MLVAVSMHRIGYVTVEPVNQRIWRKYAAHMEEYTGHADASAFFQNEYDVPEEITSHKHWHDVTRGWTVRMRVDPWVFGHWLGYDACNVNV